MAEIKIARPEDPNADPCEERRLRGRPQVRPDCDTRQVIYEAARHEFSDNGYAATSIESVARRAGVSTKTLYRLIPNKAALFEGMVSDRIDRFLSELDLQAIDNSEFEEALFAALMACADLALDKEVVAQVFRSGRGVLPQRHPARGVGAGRLADDATEPRADQAGRCRRSRRHVARHGRRCAAARRHVRRPAAAVAPADRSAGAEMRRHIPQGISGGVIYPFVTCTPGRLPEFHLPPIARSIWAAS
jgi:AcrR family transcriptional regulator